MRRFEFTTLLAATVLGVYLLVIAGATASLTEAARACSSWPLCTPQPETAVAVALGHRVAAGFIGVLILAVTVIGWRRGSDRRVRSALVGGLTLFPVQIALGALVATLGAPSWLTTAHLIVGIAIFTCLILALAWQLESETGTASDAATPRTQGGSRGDGKSEASPHANSTLDSTASERATPRATGLPTGPSKTAALVTRCRRTVWAYFRLMKPRLMWLLCLVASAGMALAAGSNLQVWTIVATLGGGILAIGASGTFNHVLERDIDRRMARTADRPVATHRVPVRNAMVFGVALTLLALAAFLQVNRLAAALGLSAILFYSVIYTLVLKPNTVQNTVVGGAAGALPALIGWAAVTGRIGLPGLALACVVFLWTPAHFYNLAMAYREDYERGGFPMLPVVRGETVTRKHVLLYLGATFAAAAALAALADLGWLYATTTVGVGGVFLWAVLRLHREQTKEAALRAFHASNAYLGLLLVAVIIDALALSA